MILELKIIIIIVGYLFLLATSGIIVRFILSRAEKGKIADKKEWDTGFIIGKCENILILTFMLLDAYIALAIIFAAKTIIREDDIKKNSLYFLAGTMINVTCVLTLSGNYTPEVNMNVKQYPWYYNDRTDTYQTVSGYYKTMVYSVVVRNNGVNGATGVIVNEVLGDGYQFLNCTTKGAGTASYDILTNTITWNIGYMPAGGKVCLSVFVLVVATGNNSPDLTVNASLVHVDQYDIPGSAKWASYSIYVPSTLDASLADNKSSLYLNPTNNPHPTPGENFSVTFKLGNTGPDDANDVKIKIYIPEGLEFVNAVVDVGTCYYDPTIRTLIWTLPLVKVGDPYLTLELRAMKEGQYRLSPIITSTSYLLSAGNLPGPLNMKVVTGEADDNGSVNPVNSVNAQGKSVGMQETGGPLPLLVMAILMVLGGLTIRRRD